MQNKKIAMGLLLATLSCSAVDPAITKEKNQIHEAVTNKSKSLASNILKYIKNNATQNPELVRSKCLELAKILNIEIGYFIKDSLRHSAAQRERFISLQGLILSHIYKYNDGPMSALIGYSDYIIRDYLNSFNTGIDDDDIDENRLRLRRKGAKSFINKINEFEKSLLN